MDKLLVPQPPPPPPPSTVKRMRRRGRDVSSRYMMTPSPISAPSSPIHPSSTSSLVFSPKVPVQPHSLPSSSRNTLLHHRKLRRIPSVPSSPDNTDSETESEPSSRYADENHRSFMTPHLPAVQAKAPTTLRKRAVRLFSDNTTQPQIIEQFNGIMEPRATLGVRRPGTPTVPNPIPTAASNLIQLGARKKTSTHECQTENFTSSSSDNLSSWDDPVNEKSRINTLGGLCHSPPIRSHGNGRARQASDLRSSMPEADLLPTTSARRPAELKDSVCRRSLNSVLSGLNTPSLLKTCHSMTEGQRSNFVRTCLPPQAPTSRLGLELKKGRKGSSRQEDVHTLCLLHNQFLLWRFVNSKGKVAMKARTITAERSLAQASAVLEELRDSVNEKRVKLENLRRMRTLSNILDVEMPLLDQWSLVDGEYSASLSGAIKSLQDASIRLPIVGDLKIDFRELKDAISSASYLFESLSSSIESFLPTADVVDKVSNNLASVASKEKALLEECGDLLSEVQMLQVKECSLRSLLLQAK